MLFVLIVNYTILVEIFVVVYIHSPVVCEYHEHICVKSR
jgi:hypothetical protein